SVHRRRHERLSRVEAGWLAGGVSVHRSWSMESILEAARRECRGAPAPEHGRFRSRPVLAEHGRKPVTRHAADALRGRPAVSRVLGVAWRAGLSRTKAERRA